VLGDVDGDGDLDLLAATFGSMVRVRLNDGAGVFGSGQDVPVDNSAQAYTLALGDVDNDGDLDLLTATAGSTAGLRVNDGSGTFSARPNIPVGNTSYSVDLGDVDGDGDLDLLTANANGANVSIRLNGGTGPLATATRNATFITLFPNPVHSTATINGAEPYTQFAVLDALGRVVLTATADADGTARLALPERLPAGIYLLHSSEQVRRLVIE
jgi:hypothetical protein